MDIVSYIYEHVHEGCDVVVEVEVELRWLHKPMATWV